MFAMHKSKIPIKNGTFFMIIKFGKTRKTVFVDNMMPEEILA